MKGKSKRAKSLTLAQRSTRAWNAGMRNAWSKGSEYYAKWLGKYGCLYHVPVWPEELLIVVEKRYGLR